MTAISSLTLNRLQLPVLIGVYPEESVKTQLVSIDVRIGFQTPPPGCYSDRLEDTHCYGKLIRFLKEKTAGKHFQLVENLTLNIYSWLKSYYPINVTLAVRVTKQPAIPELTAGVSFEYCDGPSPW